MRAREAALWELEERQIHEKQQLAKRQLKDIFFLQRHQVKMAMNCMSVSNVCTQTCTNKIFVTGI
jgi:hypothetical protein